MGKELLRLQKKLLSGEELTINERSKLAILVNESIDNAIGTSDEVPNFMKKKETGGSMEDLLDIEIKRHPVESSNIKAVGFLRNMLEIEFNSGGIYRYFDVPEEEYQGITNADSVGRYYYNNIKGSYHSERMDNK